MCDHKIYSGCRNIGSRFRYIKTERRTEEYRKSVILSALPAVQKKGKI
ncbi:hypothetical protein CK1_33570 [Ruminococcus sp. SR1/5]|nr:hypothetical protein CK1_33570 [Ruminococcus sp. SR1/5]